MHRVVRFLDAMGITTAIDLNRLQGGLHSLERMVGRRLIPDQEG